MNSHLVTIEVGVERSTNQRVKLDSTAFNEDRLECLDTQTVKCRRTVQKYGVRLDNILQCIPYIVLRSVNLLAGGLYIGGLACINKSLHNERLEKLESHLLGETALIHFQLRANDDNGTS